MIYPIYVYGSAVLRKISKPIDKDYPEFNKLVEDMFETMYDSEGVGLAAPQIGKNIRLFVVDGSAFAEEYPEAEGFKKVFVNAQIYERMGEDKTFNEGCLSLPGIRENLIRKTNIRIKYQDENFVEYDEELSGVCAWIVQHEYDHLEGMMFIDHIAPIRKTLIKSKLLKIAKGDYRAAYRTRLVK